MLPSAGQLPCPHAEFAQETVGGEKDQGLPGGVALASASSAQAWAR